MRALRIQGIVRTADRVRRQLAQPISPKGRDQLRGLVADAVRQVDRILAANHATIARLPSPSRRAYGFLKNLDFDSITVQTGSAAPAARGTIGLAGLNAFWQRTLDLLAHPQTPEQIDGLYQAIVSANRNIEQFVEEQHLRPADLTAATRAIRGWIAFFSERTNFDDYASAVRRAKPLFDEALAPHRRFRPPAVLHFRPMSALYRIQGYPDCTHVSLPTPMIVFDDGDFATLARAALAGGPRQPVMEALASDQCQAIRAELESLGGLVEHTAGLHHDLATAWQRVHQRYFDATLARPRLTWSRSFTGRKFGHYDHVRDTVMVSASLDAKNVPPFVVDYIMYHELLHKKLGFDWRSGRAHAHTAEFRDQERRFEQFAEADAVLKSLARGAH